jgi:hypothetical protein
MRMTMREVVRRNEREARWKKTERVRERQSLAGLFQ